MDLQKIKKLRELTGAGVLDVKNALEKTQGDEEKASVILRKQGFDEAKKRRDRATREGVIGSYVHTNGKIAALIEVFCESDFVAKNNEFLELAKHLAMQICAFSPKVAKKEELKDEMIEKEIEVAKEEIEREMSTKPDEIKKKILQGKIDKIAEEVVLFEQPFVLDNSVRVKDVITQKQSALSENINVGKFFRIEM